MAERPEGEPTRPADRGLLPLDQDRGVLVVGIWIVAEHDVVVLGGVLQLAAICGERPGIREAEALHNTDLFDVLLRHRFENIHRPCCPHGFAGVPARGTSTLSIRAISYRIRSQQKGGALLYTYSALAGVAKWQTQRTQNPPVATP